MPLTFGEHLERRQAADPKIGIMLHALSQAVLAAQRWPEVMSCLGAEMADGAKIDRIRHLFQEYSRANARTIHA